MRYTWAPKACAHGEGGSWVTWQLGGQNERQSWNLVTRGHPLEDGWLWRGRPSQTPPPPPPRVTMLHAFGSLSRGAEAPLVDTDVVCGS